MHVPQLLHPLLGRPYVKVVESRLPERPAQPFLPEQVALPRVSPPFLRQERLSRALLQHLHHGRRIPNLRLTHQQMNMFRHDNVSDHHKAVANARLFKNRKKAVPRLRGVQQRQSPITRRSDKVQVMSAVGTMQAAGHDKPMLQAASYPPLRQAQGGLLQRSQERGTRRSGTGKKKQRRKDGPPADSDRPHGRCAVLV